jgi:hypothetical protein
LAKKRIISCTVPSCTLFYTTITSSSSFATNSVGRTFVTNHEAVVVLFKKQNLKPKTSESEKIKTIKA